MAECSKYDYVSVREVNIRIIPEYELRYFALSCLVLLIRISIFSYSLLESGIEEVVTRIKTSLLSMSSKLEPGQSKGIDVIIKLIGL